MSKKLTDEERKARNRRAYLRLKERLANDPVRAVQQKTRDRAKHKRRYDALMALPFDSPEREAYRARRRKEENAYRADRRERMREIDRMSKARCKARDPEAYNARVNGTHRLWAAANREKVRAWKARGQRRRRSKRQAAKTIAFDKKQRLGFSSAIMSNRAYHEANAVVPRTLPRDVRDDVISSIVLACLEGTILLDEVRTKWKGFMSAYWKGRDFFGTASLDAPIGEDGATFLDFVAAPDQDLDAALDGLRS